MRTGEHKASAAVHPITLSTWLKCADTDGVKPGASPEQSESLGEANKRIRLSEQKAEVLRRALAYVSQGSLPEKGSTRS